MTHRGLRPGADLHPDAGTANAATPSSGPTAAGRTAADAGGPQAPAITLPTGGGGLRGIDEQFQANSVNGTAGLRVGLPISQGRSGFGPQLGLLYDSGAGNSPFGVGWRLTLPFISRRTDRGIPRYRDAEHSDTFVLSGMELVPLVGAAGLFAEQRMFQGVTYEIRRYRPRIESDFSRVELWRNVVDGEPHWRVTSPGNVTSVFGRSAEARIADPDDEARVFTWLLEFSHDDKGNCTEYAYRREDLVGVAGSVAEHHRVAGRAKVANAYLKRVRYGNATPFHPTGPPLSDYHFELVFDYGEHDDAAPAPDDAAPWAVRPDPFSSYRSGFEIRTYRRCRRVLMFHRFVELGNDPQLISSLRLTHATQPPGLSFLVEAELAGHLPAQGGGYTTRTMPPLSIDYEPLEWHTSVHNAPGESVEHLPAGVDGNVYRWVDLDGNGLVGVLTETASAWYYKPNLGDGRLGPLRRVAPKPTFTGLRQAASFTGSRQESSSAGVRRRALQLADLEGDGRVHAVTFAGTPQGSFAPDGEGGWEPFRPFATTPTIDVAAARLIDLTGDGRADLLVDEQNAICWYASEGADGFAAPERVRRRLDEDATPQVLFTGASESILLADMTGDGLADVVRIRNAEIAYWPNLGYGRFGARVLMAAAPRLDHAGAFDPRRIRLADVDGSGSADLVYLGQDRFRLWTNLAGNEWAAAPLEIDPFPGLHAEAFVDVVDLLGTGTACIVWSSPLPADAARPLRYVDLTGGRKPHLLTGYRNNTGKEVRMAYTPSTRFYLDAAAAGTPWSSQLPFPVHCVSAVDSIDHVTDTRLRTRYRYHHGHYDRFEREFRGFGRVDQLDTESFEDFANVGGSNVVEEELHQPPVLIKSWFSTGHWIGSERVLRHFADEYYTNTALPEQPLPEPRLPSTLTAEEQREAVRACKGLLLRREVFGLDATAEEPHPYLVTENTCTVDLLQARRDRHNAAFLVTSTETIAYHYEREPTDPRVTHTLVLERDELGNVLRAASAVYARATTDPGLPASVQATQVQTLVSVTETDFTNDVDADVPVPVYRLRMPRASRVYELTGATKAGRFFTDTELRAALAAATDIPFEAVAGSGPHRRPLAEQRTRYARDDLAGPLPFGTIESLGLVFETYRLAFTPSLLDDIYGGRIDTAMLAAAGYVGIDGSWWIPSGRSVFAPDAAQHFYLPVATRDAFGNETSVEYDGHDLLVRQITDALGNAITARNDYRTVGPDMVTDPNGNRTAARFDELGMLVATAVMGRPGSGEGDTLADPTVRIEYDLTQWTSKQRPNFVRSILREQHGAANPRFQERFTYSDGLGNVVMTKVQAEPGIARMFDPVAGAVVEVDTTPAVRWIGNGRRVLNNKGNPVRQYEPYFSVTSEYEDAAELVETGVTTETRYDPLDRALQTDLPNGTFTRTVFDPWRHAVYDANDTARDSMWYVERGSPDPAVDPEPADPEERAAWLAARHAGTPAVVHFDAVGRPVYALADNGSAGMRSTFAVLDITGSHFRLLDARGRRAASAVANLAGATCRGESAERGERWTLVDVAGNVVHAEDEHGLAFRTEYDALRRPVRAFVHEAGAAADVLAAVNVWGEQHPQATERNLRGRLYRAFDQAGTAATVRHDFKGNPTATERRFAADYRTTVDWSPLLAAADLAGIEAAAAPLLDGATFSASAEYDALNRVRLSTLPEGTQLRPGYNEANVLDSLDAQLRGAGAFRPIVVDQDYDAKGQLVATELANGTVVGRTYDPETMRLARLLTSRVADGAVLQDLRYTYDPVGNPTECADGAQQTLFFANAVVPAVWRYTYNAIYELVSATGREHAGGPTPTTSGLVVANPLPHPNDAAAVRNYTQTYTYDDLGNLLRMHHGAGTGTWDRRYRYAYHDDPADRTNRLVATSLPGDDPAGPFSATYDYDAVGNMTRMPHLANLVWALGDRLREVDLGGGGTAFYVYGSNGQRLRKVVERTAGLSRERLYLGPLEIERTIQNGVVTLERETVHLGADSAVCEVVTTTVDAADPAGVGEPVFRYQYGNMLGSTSLETDEQGQLISYEEYHPYGTTAYRSGRSAAEASLKRYRFIGKERDEETGLYLCGLRYYMPWLGRWSSPDPIGLAGGTNQFRYAANNPVSFLDPSGTQEVIGQVEVPVNVKAAPHTPAGRKTVEEWGVGRVLTIGEEQRRITGVAWHEGAWAFVTQPVGSSTSSGEGEGGGGEGGGEGSGQGGEGADTAAGPGTDPGGTQTDADPGTGDGAGGKETDTPPATPDTSSQPRPDSATHAGPAVERGIWGRSFRDRGFTLEHLYNNDIPNAIRAQGDNRPLYDVETDTHVKQIKSSNGNSTTLANHASKATRDAGKAITANPTSTMTGKAPQAVVITPTDAPAAAGADIRGGYDSIRRPVPNSVPPEHVRGLPGRVGSVGRGLTIGGGVLSGGFLVHDIATGDYQMAAADAISTVGGGLEIYALASPGATVAGVSAVSAGLALGGVGIAVGSAIGAYRAYQRGDTAGVVAGVAGVLAGIAITAGIIFGAPALLIGGLIAAVGVGLFHLGRWLFG